MGLSWASVEDAHKHMQVHVQRVLVCAIHRTLHGQDVVTPGLLHADCSATTRNAKKINGQG